MPNIGFSRSVEDLFGAADVPCLRRRLSDRLADLGFWCVSECVNSLQVTADYADIRKYLWDNLADRLGSRRDDLVSGLNAAGLPQGVEEENRRLRWAAGQWRPYLLMSGEAASFQAHHNMCSVVEDFGLRAPNTLVLPLADGGAGRLRIWAFVEDESALSNVDEATVLMTVYHQMRQLLSQPETVWPGPRAGIGAPFRATAMPAAVKRWSTANRP